MFFKIFSSLKLSEIIEICFFLISKKRKAFYIGSTQNNNLGDDALLYVTKKLLTKYHVLDLGYQMSHFFKLIIREKFIKPDIIILGGGTLIKKDAKFGFLNKINKIISLWPEVKVITFGTGTVDLPLSKLTNFPINILDWKTFFNKCDKIYVRGPQTNDFIKKIGVEKKINILGDPVIYFTKKYKKEIIKKKKIGINLANYAGRMYGQSEVDFKIFVEEIVYKLFTEKWDISYFSTCIVDEIYIKKYLLNKSNININYIKTNTINQTIDLIESFDIVLAQRLHCLIFSDCTFTPSVPIISELKFYDYFDSIGLKKTSFKTSSICPKKVYREIVRMYSNLEKESEVLFNTMNKAKTKFKKINFKNI
tara:strand:- start:2560 stop:3654 length:1095 start_codon:yes stop_codon:yes gene_type:complete